MTRLAALIDNHLLVCLALSFLTGIAAAPLSCPPPSLILSVGFGLFGFLLLLAVFSYRQKRQAVYCLLLPFFTGLGWYSAQNHLQVPQSPHLFHRIQTKTEAVIVGTLATMPTFDGEFGQAHLVAEYLRREGDQELQAVNGTILLRLAGRFPETLSPGDRLVVRTTVKRPEGGKSPGVFDYPRHLAEKGIWITGFIRSPALLYRLDSPSSTLHSLRYLPERLRANIGERIDAAVSGQSRGIYRAILIGDYSEVDDGTLEAFKGSGTMHILAISGLHMAVLGTFLYLTLYWLLSRSEWLLLRYPIRKIAATLSLPILIFYSLLAGLNTPVLRAVIMSGVVIAALCADRRKSPSALLAFAALVILAIDPLQLFTASFQLSFAAVLAILFIFPALWKFFSLEPLGRHYDFRRKIVNWLVTGLLVSLVANLATAPISQYFFNRFSVVGIIANLVVEPLVCLWSLPVGFLAVPLLGIAPRAGDFLLRIGSIGLEAARHTVCFFANWPWATFWLPSPAVWLLILHFITLLVLAIFAAQKNSFAVKGFVFLFGFVLLTVVSPKLFASGPPASLKVSFLDVGQGSSTLLEYPSGMNILIDGGGPAYGSSGSSAGERSIAPPLWHEGVNRLDAIVITHPDADHYNGLDFVIKHFSPSLLWVRDTVGHDRSFRSLLKLAGEKGVKVVVPEKGERIGSEENSLECVDNLATAKIPDHQREDRNGENSGLVLKACDGASCTLFPGDIGMQDEKVMIGLGDDITADFLLASHHGSRTSGSPEFLTAVSPRVVVVSAGRAGGEHFPHRHLIDDCARRNIPLFTTSRWGTLSLSAEHGMFRLFGYARTDDNPLRPYDKVLLYEERIGKPGENHRTIFSGR